MRARAEGRRNITDEDDDDATEAEATEEGPGAKRLTTAIERSEGMMGGGVCISAAAANGG